MAKHNLTDQEKRTVLKGFLQENGRISFAADLPQTDRSSGIDAFTEMLMSDEHVCGKALSNNIHFELCVAGETSCRVDNDNILVSLNIAECNVNAVKRIIDAALTQQKILDAKWEEEAAESDPSMPLSAKQSHAVKVRSPKEKKSGKEKKKERELASGRRHYNPRDEMLAIQNRTVHSWGDLLRNGGARATQDESGTHWLWEVEHQYVLSDEALATKTPGRWFRDLCVVCGVSTKALPRLTRGKQPAWSAVQNEKICSAGLVMQALEVVLDQEFYVGKSYKGYYLPKGSLFGLRLIEIPGENGEKNTVVDPEEMNRIMHALYKIPHVKHTLEQLRHLSVAYMRGAIMPEELKKQDIPAHLLHALIIPYGTNNKTRIHKFFTGGAPIAPVLSRLREINKEHWHIDESVFESYIHYLERLPKAGALVMTTLPPDEAFHFARLHHNGTVGGFLWAYREARGETRQDIKNRSNVSIERIRQRENQHSDTAVRDFALESQNPWRLPVDANGAIKAEIRNYLNNFPRYKHLPLPGNHWHTVQEALEQFAGQQDGEIVQEVSKPLRSSEALRNELNAAIADELKKYPDDLFPLITLPDGSDVLVKNVTGEPPRLLDYEIRPWVLAYANRSESQWADYIKERRDTLARPQQVVTLKR